MSETKQNSEVRFRYDHQYVEHPTYTGNGCAICGLQSYRHFRHCQEIFMATIGGEVFVTEGQFGIPKGNQYNAREIANAQ